MYLSNIRLLLCVNLNCVIFRLFNVMLSRMVTASWLFVFAIQAETEQRNRTVECYDPRILEQTKEIVNISSIVKTGRDYISTLIMYSIV